MRVVFIIHALEAAGAERVTALLANYLAGCGEAVTIVTFTSRKRDFYKLHPSIGRIEIDWLSSNRNLAIWMMATVVRSIRLRRFLKKVRPDVVIGEMRTANLVLALSAWPSRSWLAIGTEHIHPPMDPGPKLWMVVRRLVYPFFDVIVSPARLTSDWLKSRLKLRDVRCIPNPLVIDEAKRPDQEELGASVPAGARVVLAAGRLVEQKGFDLLIEAFAAAVGGLADWCLVILGEGEQRDMLIAKAASLGIEGRVMLPGVVRNIGDWYRKADIFAFSSRFEGFGNTLAEALAHGIPAVSFDCEAGPREILRDGVDGYLVTPGNVAGFADRLKTLMTDDALRQQMAMAAVDAKQRFALELVGEAWRRLMAEKLEANASRGC